MYVKLFVGVHMKLLVFVASMSFGVYANLAISQDYKVFVCDDCGPHSAKTVAKQKATPDLWCQGSDGNMVTLENQECFSKPQTFYVVNYQGNQVFGFDLYHTNQGGKSWEMTLEVNELNLASASSSIIYEAVGYVHQINEDLIVVTRDMDETYYTPDEVRNEIITRSFKQDRTSIQTLTSSSDVSCEDHPSYLATAHGLAPETRANLAIQLNEEYNTLNGSASSSFEKYQVTGGTIGVSKNGATFGISGEFIQESKFFTKTYGWQTPSLVGSDYISPKIVYQAEFRDGTIQVRVNEVMSIVDGVSLTELRSNNATNSDSNQLSECALEGLKVHFDYKIEPPAGLGGGGSPGGGFPGGGGTGGNEGGFPIEGGTGGGTDRCDIFYYNPWSGELMYVSKTTCP